MPPKRASSVPDRDGLPSTDHMDRLVAAFERIADEIKAIRETFDRLYDDLDWAINNGKLAPECLPRMCALADQPRAAPARDPTERGPGASSADRAGEPPAPPDPVPPATQGELF